MSNWRPCVRGKVEVGAIVRARDASNNPTERRVAMVTPNKMLDLHDERGWSGNSECFDELISENYAQLLSIEGRP